MPPPPGNLRRALMHIFRFPVLWSCRTWMRLFGCVVPASCLIQGLPSLWNMEGTVRLGERAYLNNIAMMYGRGSAFPRCVLAATPGAIIEIGDDSRISLAALYARERITIGKRVLIASGCRIADSDGHPVDEIPRKQSVEDTPSPVTIEDDVWLGCDVTVCKGVTIGKGSVIGTKSVVTHDIPPGVLAAGMPAKVIRPLRFAETGSSQR